MLLSVSSCIKNYEPELEGIWDVVNVADMNNEDPPPQEWHFNSNTVQIFNVYSPGQLFEIDSGRFVLRNTLGGLYLQIEEMTDGRYNDDWEVLLLKKDKLIISVQIPGEVIYKEFTRRGDL